MAQLGARLHGMQEVASSSLVNSISMTSFVPGRRKSFFNSGGKQMKRQIEIDQNIRKVYPEIRLGCLFFEAEVKEPDEAFWNYLDQEVLPGIRAGLEGREWGEIPGVKGSRAAYKAFGRNPGRYRVSSEALLRRVKRGDELYHINSVVDVNNLISVRSGLSAGSYDLDCINGTVTFRRALEGEGYTGIGKDFLDMENMLVLADEEGIFGSSMSDSTRAMVTAASRNIMTVIYCFENTVDLEALLEEAAAAFEKYAGAKETEILII